MKESRRATDIYTDGDYLRSNPSWHVEDSSWKAHQIKTLLKRNNLNPRTVCEVGCGAGEILRVLSLEPEDTEYFGYELSPQAFQLCKEREGPKLHFFLENIRDQDVRYDCLLCIDVFEHVEDCFGFLRALRSKAEYKVFHIPLDISVQSVVRATMCKHRKRAGHLHYYTQETAVATLEDCGYQILDAFYTTSFDGLRAQSFKSEMARLPRRLFFKISPRWAVRLLGGCSYIVLAR
jgi:hypothetical protein